MYRRSSKEWEGRIIYLFTLEELKGQDEPWPGDEWDVEEADEVAKEAGDQHLQTFQTQDPQATVWNCNLDVAVFCDELEAVEVGAHLRDVVYHGGDAKDGGVAAVILTLFHYHIDIWQIDEK